MTPIRLCEDPCGGTKRLNGSRCGVCITCGNLDTTLPPAEDGAAFIDGVWHCDRWRKHGPTVRPARPLVQSVVLGGTV